jgi:tetratricopeptide (TPR) repeat protein
MGSPAVGPAPSVSYCAQCGSKLTPIDKFCGKCGATVVQAALTSKPSVAPPPPLITSRKPEFERHLKVAWSCVKDVENKVDEIRSAKDESDREVNEGTFRGTMAMTALKGKLEREFSESLDMAWKSATKASELDANGSVEVSGVDVTPNVVFALVCSLRGDLKFALEGWDEALGLYKQALQFAPQDAGAYYNIAAAYTNKHEPQLAIEAFQKVIDLDPTGDYGIEAAKNLEKLKAGTIGKKGFTGSWKVVAVLGVFTLVSVFMIGQSQLAGPGLFNLILWGGILAFYCWRKFK